jgi:hypothetical protein
MSENKITTTNQSLGKL